jgi:hypothetical protein
MALMYPWATKEYILHSMDIGQLIFYYNEGMKQKYPDPNTGGETSVKNMPPEELKKIRQELRDTYGEVG